MIFLLRAVFWTAVVVVLVPGASHGTDRARHAAGLPTLEILKTDAISTLARVRAELNERHSRTP
jgi:hypothetical protein